MRNRRHEHQPVATVISTGKFGHAIDEIVARENTQTHLITRSETCVIASEATVTMRPLTQACVSVCGYITTSSAPQATVPASSV